MIVAFSTSSPQASVALISEDGRILASRSESAPMRSSAACIELLKSALEDLGTSLESATMFAADLGPGSFTGVKVAVTIAKTLAYSRGLPTIGAESFDLISVTETVVFPSKKGEWFVRHPGMTPVRQNELPVGPVAGYGLGIDMPKYPQAANFAHLLDGLSPCKPELLLPNYVIEPSISTPKTPLSPLGKTNA